MPRCRAGRAIIWSYQRFTLGKPARSICCQSCRNTQGSVAKSAIEKRTGVDIRYIFEKEGEARFRARERDVIADLTAQDGVVVATGGGVILDAANRERLAATGVVVYLETTIDTLVRRTKTSKARPLLMNDDPRAVLERLAQ